MQSVKTLALYSQVKSCTQVYCRLKQLNEPLLFRGHSKNTKKEEEEGRHTALVGFFKSAGFGILSVKKEISVLLPHTVTARTGHTPVTTEVSISQSKRTSPKLPVLSLCLATPPGLDTRVVNELRALWMIKITEWPVASQLLRCNLHTFSKYLTTLKMKKYKHHIKH